MNKVFLAFILGLFLCTETTAAPLESQPLDVSIRNADFQSMGATDNLTRDLDNLVRQTTDPVWAGYQVPMVPGNHCLCCGDRGRRGVYHLEGGDNFHQSSDDEKVPSGGTLMVLYRIEQGRVDKIRAFSGDCELDAGGRDVYWWSEVDPRQSLAFLENQVVESRSSEFGEGAILAIALHEHTRAGELLESFAADDQDEDVADKAIFWLGAARGESGFESLQRVEKKVRDTDLREQITFALYISKADGATPKLIEMAENDGDGEVRGQALFWLGQKAGSEASRAIKDAVENDPDLDIKKKAVFALSQLPPDEGVPLLIDVAKTHRHPKVRKQAMFWLGQSGDPRALALFEEILLK
jgi:hypothetical protein